MTTATEASILERIIDPARADLNRALAEYILELDFTPEDHARMDALAALAQDGALSAEDERELDGYLSMGHFLALLQSKARITRRRLNGAA